MPRPLLMAEVPLRLPTRRRRRKRRRRSRRWIPSSAARPTRTACMREMGSVELLTREGEIEIAKRIEDGLRHMIQAISACPTTIAEILSLAERIEKDETRVDEVVDGLVDPGAEEEPAIAEMPEDDEDIEEELEAAEEEDEEGSNAPTADQLKLKADALKRWRSSAPSTTR